MYKIVFNQLCLRRTARSKNTYIVMTAVIIVVIVHVLLKSFKQKVHEDISVSVVLSHRGMSSPSNRFSKHVYSETEDVRIRTIHRNGVFASLKPGRPGLVNVHVWLNLCGTDILTLKRFPLFPLVPSARQLWPGLEISKLGENYGKRMFGYLVAPESAGYSFRWKASGSTEFWLSTDNKPQNSKCLAYRKEGITTITELKVELQKSKWYYFEVLHQHGGRQRNDYFKLEWRIAQGTDYGAVPWTNLRSYQHDLDILGDVVNVQSFPPLGLEMHGGNGKLKTGSSSLVSREEIYKLPFIPAKTIKDLFPECQYKPDYLVNYKVDRYGSKWENIYSSIYPSDDTNVTDSSGFVTFGNDVLEKEKALEIVDMVIGQFHKKGLRHFSLENIINIESKRGRYLVELQLFDGDTKKSVRFSEYLYIPKGSSKLCYPEGFTWNKTNTVNFIVTSGYNQGRWVHHFIQNMAKIYEETKDNNFNVIINDFLCPGADIKQALESSSLPNYLYLTNTGVFYKTLGLQQAADSITDPNAIVVILDLHLDIPAYFVDDIRKHTIQGLQFYSPVLMRMECGTNAAVDMGSYWEFHGYGLVGIYKNDWDKFGGMNVEEFKYKWGGEDIEMTDRILMEGFESERKKIKGLVHYYHPKHGMWNKHK